MRWHAGLAGADLVFAMASLDAQFAGARLPADFVLNNISPTDNAKTRAPIALIHLIAARPSSRHILHPADIGPAMEVARW